MYLVYSFVLHYYLLIHCLVFYLLTADCQWLRGTSVECRIARMSLWDADVLGQVSGPADDAFRCSRASIYPVLLFITHYVRNATPPVFIHIRTTYFQIDPRLQFWWAAAVAAVNPKCLHFMGEQEHRFSTHGTSNFTKNLFSSIFGPSVDRSIVESLCNRDVASGIRRITNTI